LPEGGRGSLSTQGGKIYIPESPELQHEERKKKGTLFPELYDRKEGYSYTTEISPHLMR